ncbi:MAG: hypothetical protein KBS89_01230 [Bacteroidales bacterium]|nr:hypothetical protein [Candidatus Egerieousia equi]
MRTNENEHVYNAPEAEIIQLISSRRIMQILTESQGGGTGGEEHPDDY